MLENKNYMMIALTKLIEGIEHNNEVLTRSMEADYINHRALAAKK